MHLVLMAYFLNDEYVGRFPSRYQNQTSPQATMHLHLKQTWLTQI